MKMKMYLHVCSKTVLRLESEEAFVKSVRCVSQRSVRGLVASCTDYGTGERSCLVEVRTGPDRFLCKLKGAQTNVLRDG
jgi:hypothetical protein